MQVVWHRVGTRAEIDSRKLRRALAGTRWVALHVHGGRVHAIGDTCPHRGATLSNGVVGADGFVACPEHGWEYSLLTGAGREAWEGCVARYEVEEREGEVFVAVPRS
jgi:nitrite reductase (NADH) small subunit